MFISIIKIWFVISLNRRKFRKRKIHVEDLVFTQARTPEETMRMMRVDRWRGRWMKRNCMNPCLTDGSLMKGVMMRKMSWSIKEQRERRKEKKRWRMKTDTVTNRKSTFSSKHSQYFIQSALNLWNIYVNMQHRGLKWRTFSTCCLLDFKNCR